MTTRRLMSALPCAPLLATATVEAMTREAEGGYRELWKTMPQADK